MLESTSFKFHGPGEWDRLKHGEKRRSWRKSHIAIDAGTGEVLAHEVTDSNTSDAAMAGPLFANTGGRIRLVIADGAYNGEPVYEAIRSARPPRSSLKVVIRPHAPTIPPWAPPAAAPNASVMPARSVPMAGWLGRRRMETAGARWSRP